MPNIFSQVAIILPLAVALAVTRQLKVCIYSMVKLPCCVELKCLTEILAVGSPAVQLESPKVPLQSHLQLTAGRLCSQLALAFSCALVFVFSIAVLAPAIIAAQSLTVTDGMDGELVTRVKVPSSFVSSPLAEIYMEEALGQANNGLTAPDEANVVEMFPVTLSRFVCRNSPIPITKTTITTTDMRSMWGWDMYCKDDCRDYKCTIFFWGCVA